MSSHLDTATVPTATALATAAAGRPPGSHRFGWKVWAAAAALLAAAGVAVAVVATGDDPDRTPPTVGIESSDGGLAVTGADAVRPGWTRITDTNAGDQAHALILARLHDGVDVPRFQQGLKTPDGIEAMQMADFVGGVDDIVHGTTFAMTVDLTPGRYVLVDHAQDVDGAGWFTRDQFLRGFATADLDAREFAFDLPSSLAPDGTLHITNVGGALHQAAMLALDPGATVEQALASVVSEQPPPGTPLELFGVLSPGEEMYLDYHLDPGHYMIGCFMPGPDGTPHAALGMVSDFTVA